MGVVIARKPHCENSIVLIDERTNEVVGEIWVSEARRGKIALLVEAPQHIKIERNDIPKGA